MNINCTKDHAIKILSNRLLDLNASRFDANSWKSRTVADLKTIFPLSDDRWQEIDHLRFYSIIDSRFLSDTVYSAEKLIQSYIDYVNDHIPDTIAIAEVDYRIGFEQEQQISSQLRKSNDLLEKEINKLNNIDSEKIERIKYLTDNMLQLENFNLMKLKLIITNLPWKNLTVLWTILIALMGVCFYLGTLFAKLHLL